VARICHVAPRTVSKWFDTGKLRGYRIPGSRDRRIPRTQLLAFMRAHGIPIDCLEETASRVLIVGAAAGLKQELEVRYRYHVHVAVNRFEAGMLAQQLRPHVVVLEAAATDAECQAICRSIKQTEGLEMTRVVLACAGASAGAVIEPFDDVLPLPYQASQLAAAVERATDLLS
jgi:excisionase family DNA binding protein